MDNHTKNNRNRDLIQALSEKTPPPGESGAAEKIIKPRKAKLGVFRGNEPALKLISYDLETPIPLVVSEQLFALAEKYYPFNKLPLYH